MTKRDQLIAMPVAEVPTPIPNEIEGQETLDIHKNIFEKVLKVAKFALIASGAAFVIYEGFKHGQIPTQGPNP